MCVRTGIAASATGVVAFAAVHALLIAPVWTQALVRAPLALVAGIAVAWAFEERFAQSGVQTLGDAVGFGALLFTTLVPATLFENALRLYEIRLGDTTGMIVVIALAAASGAAAAAIGTRPRARHAALAFASATVAMTTIMGGPIPVVNSARAAWLFLSFLPICIAAGITLALVRRIRP